MERSQSKLQRMYDTTKLKLEATEKSLKIKESTIEQLRIQIKE
jgi:hypothetical protein